MIVKERRRLVNRKFYRLVKTLAVWVLTVSLLFSNANAIITITAMADATPAGVPFEDIEAVVDNIMADKIGIISPGASVVIVKDGEIVFCKGYGVSDVAAGTLVIGTDTIFEIGSVTKLFTWTALMQLVEEGKVNLQSDIREYIGYDRLDLSFERPITVLDLMNHTAGFEENISEIMTFDKEKLISLEKWVSREHQPKQIYEPGSTIAYSNFSTDIAGLIIQLQSGRLYENYVQERIFEPLKMNMSTAYADFYHVPHIAENKSNGYHRTAKGFMLTPENFINEAPAGAVASTAEDMGRFMIAHMNYEETAQYSLFASAETLREMHTDSFFTPGIMPSNAHGFWVREESGVRLLEHGGSTTNFTASLSITPEENFGICVLTNVEGEASGIRTEIVNKLSAGFTHEAKVNPEINRSINLSGTYASARTIKSTFLSIVYLIPEGIIVKDLKNGEIEVRFANIPTQAAMRYAEIEPLVFERSDSVPSMLDIAGVSSAYLQFITDDFGKVEIVRTGAMGDYIRQPLLKYAPLNRFIVLFCMAVFVLGIVYGIVARIFAKKRRALSRSKAGMLLPTFGLLSGVNAVISIFRIMGDPSTPIGNYKIHLIINLVFAFVMAVSAVFMVFSLPDKKVTKKDKVVNILLMVSAGLFIFWLINYNLLAFWRI